MSSAKGIKAGRAFIVIEAVDKTAKVLRMAQKNLNALADRVMGIGAKITAAGATMLAPLALSANTFMKMGDEMLAASLKTGMGVEALSELKYAAEQSNVSFGTLQSSIARMQKVLAGASRRSKASVDALARIGLTIDDLKGKTPDQQFALIADQISKIEDPSLRAARAMDIFGRGGAQLLPMFEGGAAGIEELRRQAQELGLTMSGDDAVAADKLADAFDTLKSVIAKTAFTVGAALATHLQKAVDKLIAISSATMKWIDQNRGLVVVVAKVALGVIATGMAVVGLGLGIKLLASSLGGLALGLTAFSTAFSLLAKIPALLALALNPISLVVAAIATIGVIAYQSSAQFRESLGKAAEWVSAKFARMAAFVTTSYNGIVAAVKNGDLAGAWDIALGTMDVAWKTMVDTWMVAWNGFTGFFVEAFHKSAALVKASIASIQKATTNWLLDTFEKNRGLSKLVTGVDIAGEREKSDRLEAERKRLLEASGQEYRPQANTVDMVRGQVNQEYDDRIAGAFTDSDAAIEKWRKSVADAEAARQKAIDDAMTRLNTSVEKQTGPREALDRVGTVLDKGLTWLEDLYAGSVSDQIASSNTPMAGRGSESIENLERGSVEAMKKYLENNKTVTLASEQLAETKAGNQIAMKQQRTLEQIANGGGGLVGV